ncbi:MAG: hypothetical protein V4666_06280 [Bacteroidota bacterium]
MENEKIGVGRKLKKDKKVTVNLYVLQSVLDKFGDGYELREFLYKCIDEKVNGVSVNIKQEDQALLAEMLEWFRIHRRNEVIDGVFKEEENKNVN